MGCSFIMQRESGPEDKKDTALMEFMELLIHLRTVVLQDLTELVRFYPEDHLLWQVPVIRHILDQPEFTTFSAEVQAAVEGAVTEDPVNITLVRV